ncbi:MAG: single-stranded DNA-binding protein [Dehalococcoidia bacterium]|nr:single-stranded DNA-binding protein [Dehalococcoidia bacterium]
MAGLNKVMLIGNAGKDAELRYTANGTAQAQFSLAVNSRRRAPSGEWQEQTEWFNIVLWAESAERMSQYITKGKQLFIEGRLQTRTWDDDQGQKHYRTEVIANTVQFLGSRGSGDESGGGGGGWGDGETSYAGGGRGAAGNRGGGPRGGGSGGGGWNSGGGGGSPMDADDLPFE